MEAAIKEALQTSTLKGTGRGGGGCINEGEVYLTDHGKVFLKRNGKSKARLMFDGEYESLKAINATGEIKAPKPLVVVDNPAGGAVLVMEHIEIRGLARKTNILGDQLARLHLHNIGLESKSKIADQYVGAAEKDDSVKYVPKFGFHVDTCCGYIPQDNSWCDDWLTLLGRKLQDQINGIEKEYGDREALRLWSALQLKLPQFFKGLEIKPSLLHGDLWSGNSGETKTEPVIFDPASFYGHHEYDLAIAGMFGGYGKAFWDGYHNIIPRAEGWDKRHKLYTLFHNLNHWNHFGSGYRAGSLDIMKGLIK